MPYTSLISRIWAIWQDGERVLPLAAL